MCADKLHTPPTLLRLPLLCKRFPNHFISVCGCCCFLLGNCMKWHHRLQRNGGDLWQQTAQPLLHVKAHWWIMTMKNHLPSEPSRSMVGKRRFLGQFHCHSLASMRRNLGLQFLLLPLLQTPAQRTSPGLPYDAHAALSATFPQMVRRWLSCLHVLCFRPSKTFMATSRSSRKQR